MGTMGPWDVKGKVKALITKNNVAAVIIMDKEVAKVVIRVIWLTEIHGVGQLIVMFLEKKQLG